MIAGRTWADIVEEEEARMGVMTIQSSTSLDQQQHPALCSPAVAGLAKEVGEGKCLGENCPSTPTPALGAEHDESLTAATVSTVACQDQAVIPTTQTTKDTKNNFVKDIVKKWHEQSKPKKVVTIVRPAKDSGHYKSQMQDSYKKVNSLKDGIARVFEDEDDQVVVTYITSNKKQGGLKRTASLATSGSPRAASPSRVLSRASSFEHQGTSESSESTLATVSSNSLKANKYVPPHLRKTLSDGVDSDTIAVATSLDSPPPPLPTVEPHHQRSKSQNDIQPEMHALPAEQDDNNIYALPDQHDAAENVTQDVHMPSNGEQQNNQNNVNDQNTTNSNELDSVEEFVQDENINSTNEEYVDDFVLTEENNCNKEQHNLSAEQSYTLESNTNVETERQYAHTYLDNQQSSSLEYMDTSHHQQFFIAQQQQSAGDENIHAFAHYNMNQYMNSQPPANLMSQYSVGDENVHAFADYNPYINSQQMASDDNIHAFADYQYTDSCEYSSNSQEELKVQQQQQQQYESVQNADNGDEIVDESIEQKFESGECCQNGDENGGCSALNVNAADFQMNCGGGMSWNPMVCQDYGMYGMQYGGLMYVPPFYDASAMYGYQYGYQHDSQQQYYEEDGQYETKDYTLQKQASLPPSFGKFSKSRGGYKRGGQGGWRRGGRGSRDLESDWRTQKEQRNSHRYGDEDDRIICAPRYRKERDFSQDRIIEVSISTNTKKQYQEVEEEGGAPPKQFKVLLGNQGEKKEIVVDDNTTTH